MTTDIDAMIIAASSMKEAINSVGDRYDLPNGWLNADFKNTSSYTPNLFRYSEYYRTYSNVVSIRTVSAEYLIAMKLRSGRQYKNDLSDILGILAEHEKRGIPLNLDQIKKAFIDLYGNWDLISDSSRTFVENIMKKRNFEEQYKEVVREELDNNILLTEFENHYPGAVKTANADDIILLLRKKDKKN
ncbi:MAG: hypothetical protein IKP86_03680 [Anaerolineaceae bacterium]|nr:hypothetical protein [Anaerolineaceae bacterium]